MRLHATGPSRSDGILNQMEEGTASMQRYVSSSLTRITSGVSGGVNTQLSRYRSSSLCSAQRPEARTKMGNSCLLWCDWLCSIQLPSSTQLAYFAALLGSGIFFLVLAFSLFLPVIILSPSKFALTFTVGSILLLSAFMTLRGWESQVAHLFSSDRLIFTTGAALAAAAAVHLSWSMNAWASSWRYIAVE